MRSRVSFYGMFISRIYVIASLGISVGLLGCEAQTSELSANSSDLVTVRTAVATAGESDRYLRLPARVEPSLHVLIHARATGLVSERRVDLGDVVKAGQVLAIIHAPEVDQAVREAEANRRQVEADLKLARTKFERARTLLAANAMAKEQHDEREGVLAITRANLAAASARLANLLEQQSFQIVRAAIDGTITARNIERGDRVIADQGAAAIPLFELSAIDPLRIVVYVPQDAAPLITKGQPASFKLSATSEEQLDTKVVRFSKIVSPDSGGMRVELEMSNPRQAIRPGMTGQVVLRLGNSSPLALVPIGALVQHGAITSVFRIADDGTLQLQRVKVGRNLGNQVEILEGVSIGDRVVLSPNMRLKPGQKIQLQTARV
ncbi:efflux RND transporter periplasmic adaptor subunit [Pseudomonas aeruginosa]|uniref:efflux RND transporter periplasmic adaptor subunit n=1 Tax=Pseudomonas aeruginosa TaxID=287 RepID=UPI001A220524|nr:efflux RND transporter periplasmic adaptor subunit [Pseudomonas aeruginosa]MBG7461068.1 efflux RND transporter periplasmic adaptor subunit [Pseudomonas aeruginosa]MDG3710727.1 efflux RND transporter periplasmic adaptor subunit [Pseudomonas aeruginosa]HBO3623448.1 efflux RND transporter periplasmic adaptor subunit [Pseudomonas aeruginosa]HCF5590240.1 efflux RND transporter periplasmic adaptor subunit [Pseudomonas aeruginosa]